MRYWLEDGTTQGMLQSFKTLTAGVAQRPQVYGVAPEDAAEAVRLVSELERALDVANDPATRTTLTVAAKNAAFDAAAKHLKPMAQFIRMNLRIGAEDLAAVGLPPKAERRRVPPPSTAPMLSIRGVIPGGHELEIFDSAAPDRPGKPEDVKGLELFVAYSPHHGTGEGLSQQSVIANGKFHSLLTRKTQAVIHPNERVGSVANYIGRWINARREAGPFSQPVRMLLAMPGNSTLSQAA